MKLDPGRAAMAIAVATLSSGPIALIGMMAIGLVTYGTGNAGMSFDFDATVLWLLAYATFLGVFVSAIPNAILVAGLGLLGRGQPWARAYPVWIAAGLACGLFLAWRLSPAPAESLIPVVLAGAFCGLIARLCVRWQLATLPTS